MRPETFEDELQRRCGRHYRLRWSHARRQWQIEHKVRRALDVPSGDDRLTRLREGYHLVLETPEAPFLPCPACHLPIALPVFEKAEVFCDYCASRGRKVRVIGGYFPLVDRTLTYLEQWHPRRGDAIRAEESAHNAALSRRKEREVQMTAEAIAAEDWRRVFGVPRVGYTKVGTPHSFGA